MSWLNSLFSGTAPQQTQQPAPTGQPPAANPGVETPQNGPAAQQVAANVQQTTQTAQTSANPLDILSVLGQNNANSQTSQAPSLSIPQDTLSKIAQSIDYSKAIPQEALQQLQQGDMSALGTILNSALQQQYVTLMEHQSAITNKFVQDRLAHEQGNLQQAMRGNIVDSSLNIQDLHPTAQAMFRDVAKGFARQYPEATPQDIEQRTWEVMENLGNQFNRTQKQQAKAQTAAEVDWDKYLG